MTKATNTTFRSTSLLRQALLLGCAAVVLSACEQAGAPPLELSTEGFGKARFGAPLAELESALGETAPAEARSAACTQVQFKAYPGLRFMVEKGIVTRADAQGDVPNTAKVAVGALQADVVSKHPRIEVWPHKYDEKAQVLMLAEEKGVFVFETKEGRISGIRAGVRPAVEYVEGCS